MTPTKKDWEEVYSGVPMFSPTEADMEAMARIWDFNDRGATLPTATPESIQHELGQLQPRFRGRPAEL